MESLAFTVACTPTTAFNLRSATVVAGSARFTWPALSCATSVLGSASTSTLSPTASAVVGLTPWTTWCIWSVSVQNASSPNVSNRKMCCPSSNIRSMGELVGVGVESVHAATDATSAAISQRCVIGHLSVEGLWVVKQAGRCEPATRMPPIIATGTSGGQAALQVGGPERAPLRDERPCVVHLSPRVPQQNAPHPAVPQIVDHAFPERFLPIRHRLEPGVQLTHRLIAQVEQVRIEERQVVVAGRPARHIQAGRAPHGVGVVFVLQPQPGAEGRIPEAGAVPRRGPA